MKNKMLEARMLGFLAEAKLPSGEIIDDPEKYIKAAQILILGLHHELPDNPSEAVMYLMDIFRTLLRKRMYIYRALRIRSRKPQARVFLQKVRREL